jgi:hypothetical protein
MMPLLSQVYSGRIGKEEAKLDEYGGQKMEAQVVEGIKIAAIEQRDLEYDPALYRRDRGELDWDARSMASTALMSDNMSIAPSQSQGFTTGPIAGYDNYLASGPGTYELARFDSQQEPLLSSGVYEQGYQSQQSLAMPPAMYRNASTDGLSREAPLHRPQDYFGDYPQRSNSPYMETRSQTPVSQYPPHPTRQFSTTSAYAHSPQQSSQSLTYPPQDQNVAGRGTFRS